MKNRIKQIRKENKMTQVEFGEKIGVKGNTVTNYENGLRNPTDAVVLSICREFNINENWLRNGIKPMYKESFSDYVDNIPSEDKDFIKELIEVYKGLDPDSKAALKLLARKMLSNNKKSANTIIPLEKKEPADALILNAAHARTDIKSTADGKSHDDAIMDNDEEWK